MQIVNKKLSEIEPYEKNPRKNDEAVKYVANSIKEFGFKVPIVIDKDGIIVAGHTRYKAARKLHLDTVPCVIADDLTDEQVKAFRLADNKVGEMAEWDIDLLEEELRDLTGFDMDIFGFESEEDDNDQKEAEEDNFEPAIPAIPKSKIGEVYQLGRHRLMVGDSTKADDVKVLMDGALADMLLTDPPYNIALGKDMSIEEAKIRRRRTDGLTIQNDAFKTEQDFRDFLKSALQNGNDNLKSGGVFYIWHAEQEAYNFRGACNDIGWKVRQNLIWNKNTFALCRQDYQWKHEPCLYGWKDGAAHYFIDDRKQSTVFEDQKPDFAKMKKEEMQKLLEEIYSDKVNTTILNEKKPTQSSLHPTMKPLKLMGRQIKNSTKRGELVLDLFGGSGSTLMASEQLGRKCYTMECDPRYADVIIDRWETYTGEKAKRIKEAE